MNHTKLYDAVMWFVKTNGLTIHHKRSSPLMWTLYAISFMWIWNRQFMDHYWTTIPALGRVYVPGELDARAWPVLAHEGMHGEQAERVGEPWFSLGYLFPQVPLALLVLASVPFLGWWSAFGVVVLAPWPAPWRVLWEREAYRISMVCDALCGQDLDNEWYIAHHVNHYSWPYYKPAWRASKVRAFVLADIERAKRMLSGEDTSDTYANQIIELVKVNK